VPAATADTFCRYWLPPRALRTLAAPDQEQCARAVLVSRPGPQTRIVPAVTAGTLCREPHVQLTHAISEVALGAKVVLVSRQEPQMRSVPAAIAGTVWIHQSSALRSSACWERLLRAQAVLAKH
jgi:hypothetical protein